jgi:hypothetical protein
MNLNQIVIPMIEQMLASEADRRLSRLSVSKAIGMIDSHEKISYCGELSCCV